MIMPPEKQVGNRKLHLLFSCFRPVILLFFDPGGIERPIHDEKEPGGERTARMGSYVRVGMSGKRRLRSRRHSNPGRASARNFANRDAAHHRHAGDARRSNTMTRQMTHAIMIDSTVSVFERGTKGI